MPRADSKLSKPRKRKWRRRLLIGGGALLVAAVATPFLFTGPLVRLYLAHSAYRNVPIRFRSATLSPAGALTLYDLVIDDVGESAGRKLLSADWARISFAWGQVSSNRLKTIHLENVDLTLRPGTDTPLTMWRTLASLTESLPASAQLPAAPAASPLWFDQLLVTGKVRLEGYQPWLTLAQVHAGDPLVLQLVMKSTGSAANPTRDVSLIVGETDSTTRPYLTTRFSVGSTAQTTTLACERLVLGNLSPTATDAVLRAAPGLPAALRHEASGHFERLIASGSLTLGKENTINATVELRDLSAHAGSNLVLEHVTASGHVEGKLTAAPLKDLKFTRTHCSWDTAQWDDWRVQRGIADFQVEGSEIVLTDLQATFAEAELRAAGAFDTSSGILSRGRVWLNNFEAAKVLPRLPESIRQGLRLVPDGTLSARVFLSEESDADHVAAHVELVCPDDLVLHAPRLPAMATATAATVATSSTAPAAPGAFAVVTNMDLSGTVSWNYKAAVPEVSHGRLTADEFLVVPGWNSGSLEGLPVSKIKSDFTLQSGVARLDDFYADLPGNGRITAEAQYVLARQSLEEVMLSLNGVDAALADPWLPAGWTLTGQLDTEVRGSFTPQDATLQASMGLAQQTVLKNKDAALTISGTPPAMVLRGVLNRSTGVAQIQIAEISGLGAIQADPGLVKLAKTTVAPAPGSNTEALFETIKTGAMLSFDKMDFDGPLRLAAADGQPPSVAGTLTFSGLDLAAVSDADKAPSLLNLTLKTGVLVPLAHPDWDTIRLTEGTFLAEKITLGPNVFAGLEGQLALDKGKLNITHAALQYAEGTVEGDATVLLPGDLDALHLNFTGLHQQVLTRSFYPDVVTAEGPVSGNLTLERQTGVITMKADGPGKLRISRDASKSTFAPVARAAVQSPDTILPANFEDIVMDQLADYSYLQGAAKFQDGPKGLSIQLDYTRRPLQEGEAGYGVPVTVAGNQIKASLPFHIHGSITVVDYSIRKLLQKFVGFRDSLVAPATRPETRPGP